MNNNCFKKLYHILLKKFNQGEILYFYIQNFEALRYKEKQE